MYIAFVRESDVLKSDKTCAYYDEDKDALVDYIVKKYNVHKRGNNDFYVNDNWSIHIDIAKGYKITESD